MKHLDKMSATEHTRLDSLDPSFKPKAFEVLEEMDAYCERQQYHVIVAEGLRDSKKQLELYSHGRALKDGKWVVVDKRAFLTKAPPGSSPHEYGMALDVLLYPDTTDSHPLPLTDKHPGWRVYGAIATKHGLTWGGNFREFFDGPHMEDPTWKAKRTAVLKAKEGS